MGALTVTVENKSCVVTIDRPPANATNRAEIAEARAARLGSLRDYLVELRDKAPLLTTKSIYQALIDRIDEKTSQP